MAGQLSPRATPDRATANRAGVWCRRRPACGDHRRGRRDRTQAEQAAAYIGRRHTFAVSSLTATRGEEPPDPPMVAIVKRTGVYLGYTHALYISRRSPIQ